MFKIKDGTIHCSRGDQGIITLKIPIINTDKYYQFNVGDKVKLNIYNKRGYGQEPLKTKEVIITEICDSVDIHLTESDTTFGEIQNKPTIYWYDITLNDSHTIVCFNEEGAKEFIQYPARGGDE